VLVQTDLPVARRHGPGNQHPYRVLLENWHIELHTVMVPLQISLTQACNQVNAAYQECRISRAGLPSRYSFLLLTLLRCYLPASSKTPHVRVVKMKVLDLFSSLSLSQSRFQLSFMVRSTHRWFLDQQLENWSFWEPHTTTLLMLLHSTFYHLLFTSSHVCLLCLIVHSNVSSRKQMLFPFTPLLVSHSGNT
jgi:hypothetical protein